MKKEGEIPNSEEVEGYNEKRGGNTRYTKQVLWRRCGIPSNEEGEGGIMMNYGE